MKVLFVCAVNGHGGPVRSACTVIRASTLDRVIVATQPIFDDDEPSEIEQLADAVIAIPRPVGVRALLTAQLRLLRAVNRGGNDVDVIHANGLTEVVVALPVALVRGIPVVVWVHNWEVPRPFRGMRGLVRLARDRVRWLAVSGLARDLVAATGVVAAEAVTIVPNPIDLDVVPSQRAPSERLRICYLAGSDRASKGFDLVGPTARALADLPVYWIVYSSPPFTTNEAGWRALQDLPDSRYEFRWRVAQISEAFAECDVVFAPSRRESFNRVIAEAMVNGLPVVASDLSVHRELLGDDEAGLLFQNGDPVDAARALRQVVIDRSLSERLGACGRERSAQFAPDAVASAILETYESACAGSAQHGT